MAKAIDVLRSNQCQEPSKWKERALWHRENWGWLKHSMQIALKAKRQMDALGLTQKILAERMGCSQQYVSLILKGKENLTLETISKMERVLDCDLFAHTSESIRSHAYSINQPATYLNEPEESE